MRKLLRRTSTALLYLLIVILVLWPTLALFFDLPFPHLRIAAAISYLLVVTVSLVSLRHKPARLLLGLASCALVASWWLTLKPTNKEPWQTDVSRLASATQNGNHVIIHNFRQCDYRAEFDYTCKWSDRDVDLSQIRGVDLFMDYWGSPWIAHTILSFDVGNGQHVAFSIEQRKRPGQNYSNILGFYRQYTLIVIASDERDLVRLRTNYRHGEDLYLFHTLATPGFARALFTDYIQRTNDFYTRPHWYNAVTHNCTTEIYTFARMKHQPHDWRILLNGKGDEMEYQAGEIAGDLPFKQLKQQSYINPAARAADQDPDFSRRIREGLPGFKDVLQ